MKSTKRAHSVLLPSGAITVCIISERQRDFVTRFILILIFNGLEAASLIIFDVSNVLLISNVLWNIKHHNMNHWTIAPQFPVNII